jgi:hypothetical protein
MNPFIVNDDEDENWVLKDDIIIINTLHTNVSKQNRGTKYIWNIIWII